MKVFFLMLAVLTFAACTLQKPVSSAKPSNNKDYTVTYLFEYGGCKVYRFLDGGYTVYFTNCNGEAIAKTDSLQVRNVIRVPKN